MRTTTPDRCVTRDTPGPNVDTRASGPRARLIAWATACALLGCGMSVGPVHAQEGMSSHERELMPARIRVGLPAGTRHHLLFACDPLRPATTFRGQRYTVDSLGSRHFVLRREPGSTPVFGAPDTLDVTLYSEAADQEIALERGDLDVAVFWPGERSARIRDDERWRDAPRGVRARGALVAVASARDSGQRAPARDLRLLNRMMFSGDLVAWEAPTPRIDSSETAARYAVESTLPGAKLLERVLSRLAAPTARRTVRLGYAADARRDTLAEAWRTPLVQPVFAVGCPVLVSGVLARTFVDAPSADDWAALLSCPGEPR